MSTMYIRLKERHQALGIPQAELAARAGVCRVTVSWIENAHVTAVDLSVLVKLADVLAVEPGFSARPHTGRVREPGTGARAAGRVRQQ